MMRCSGSVAPLFGHNNTPCTAVLFRTLAPIRVHTLRQNPEKMHPSRPTRRGQPMGSTRIARLSLWQKLNLVHALAPALPNSAALDRRGEPSRDGPQQAGGVLARRLKPRKSLWAVMGSRMRQMPAGCLQQHTRGRGRPTACPPSANLGDGDEGSAAQRVRYNTGTGLASPRNNPRLGWPAAEGGAAASEPPL